jgi:predicted RNA-binding protein with PUA-like domain
MSTTAKCWLLKAEPDSRVVKGKDVKVRLLISNRNCFADSFRPSQFSVDDFETVETSPWEGVRNYEARNLMLEMKVGDKAS